jgi:hypothetical protein
MVEPAEVADDGRQRNGDDRLVERGQEHAEHQRGEHGAQRRPGQRPVVFHLSSLPAPSPPGRLVRFPILLLSSYKEA